MDLPRLVASMTCPFSVGYHFFKEGAYFGALAPWIEIWLPRACIVASGKAASMI